MRIDRRILLAALALFGIAYGASAQFVKGTMNGQVTSNFPDNMMGQIPPSTMRAFMANIISSYQQAPVVNAQTGVSYTVIAADYGKLITFNNSGAVAVTLPFFSPFNFYLANLGAGAVTITPSGATINGNATITVAQNASLFVVSDSVNWQVTGIVTAITGTNTITNANLVQMTANGFLGNNTGGTSNVLDLTPGQAGNILCGPNIQIFTTGTTQTYTTPTCNSVTPTYLEAHVQGGGAGGGSSGSGSNSIGTVGNTSVFGNLAANQSNLGTGFTANGGSGGGAGTPANGGAGGTCSGSLVGATAQNFPGSAGASAVNTTANSMPGGMGGVSYYGGYGAPTVGAAGTPGGTAPANSGGGGAGGPGNATASVATGAGGGAGCHIWAIITSPNPTYVYSVGGTASGANAGTSGSAGGGGAAGLVTVVGHWQ